MLPAIDQVCLQLNVTLLSHSRCVKMYKSSFFLTSRPCAFLPHPSLTTSTTLKSAPTHVPRTRHGYGVEAAQASLHSMHAPCPLFSVPSTHQYHTHTNTTLSPVYLGQKTQEHASPLYLQNSHRPATFRTSSSTAAPAQKL